MRTCPNCGHMLSEKDTICFKCGMQLSQIQKPAGMGPMAPNNPAMMGMGNRGGQRGMMPSNGGDDKSKTIYLVLGLVVVLAVIAVVIVFVGKNNKVDDKDEESPQVVLKKEEPEPKKEEPQEPTEPEKPVVKEPETPTQPETPTPDPGTGTGQTHQTPIGGQVVVPDGYHLVSNNGYSYAVPDEYTAKDYGTQGFDIINYQKTKEMMISISLGTLANLKQTLPEIKQMYIDSGAVVHNIKITTIASIEMICVELTKNGQNMVIGITDAAAGEIFVVAVYNHVTNAVDYDILAEGSLIVQSAVKNTGGTIQTASI